MDELHVSCPKCYESSRQVKDGHTASGSQRFRCRHCSCRYTPFPQSNGYDEEVRFQALQLYLEGMSIRQVARLLDVNHQSVANWMKDYTRYLPPDLPPSIAEMARLEGLYVL